MNGLRGAASFVYDFVIGDDPLIAAVVAAALGATAILADSGAGAWWVLPLAVVTVLSISLHRATR